ncbi:MAG: arylesterase [Bacteroidota bacterium]
MNRYHLLFFLGFGLLIGACSTETAKKPADKTSTPPVATAAPTLNESEKESPKTILFFGNSLTAAYGLDPQQGFVGLIDQRIDSLGLNYEVINSGLSGETTAGGNSRVEWILEHHAIDIFILELGGNDALRGLNVTQSTENLQAIIDKVKNKFPEAKIILAGMLAPPNMGPTFSQQFAEMYPRLAKANELALIPFLLDGVGGVPELNLPDGIHPNVAGHRIVTENIWTILQPLL